MHICSSGNSAIKKSTCFKAKEFRFLDNCNLIVIRYCDKEKHLANVISQYKEVKQFRTRDFCGMQIKYHFLVQHESEQKPFSRRGSLLHFYSDHMHTDTTFVRTG